jgi:hypothetical protein
VGYGVNPQIRHLRTKEALGVPQVQEKLHEDPLVARKCQLSPLRVGDTEPIDVAYILGS